MAANEQTLSLDELAALREMTMQEEPDEPREARAAQVKVLNYNFRQPGQLSASQLRALKVVHEFFAKRLSESQPKGLAANLGLALQSVETVSYAHFMGSLTNPCYLLQLSTRFEEPVLLDVNLGVMKTLVARLLGDRSALSESEQRRPLTSIEESIAGSMMESLLPMLGDAWALSSAVTFSILSTDSDPRFVQVMPDDHPVVSLTFLLTADDIKGSFTLCYPLEPLKELVEGMSHRMTGGEEELTANEGGSDRILSSFKGVPVEMRAELGTATVLTSQLVELRVGDVLCLDRKINEPLELFINDARMFKAKLGRKGDVLSLQVSQRCRME
jgi:flagellar motor switch protein FliM